MKENAIILICGFWAMFCIPATGKIIYVDDDAPGANNGSSWENAYIYLQDALNDANSAEKPIKIHVAQGIYKPDMGEGITPGDREASFELINDVTLSGGYAGILGHDPNERDYEKYETILSGDLNGNDIDINDLQGLWNMPSWQENSYHVIICIDRDSTTVLNGFTVTGGHANGSPYEIHSKGGGMYNENGKPTITHCMFIRNAGLYGAGLYNNNSQPLINETNYEENIAYLVLRGDVGFGGMGGGIYNKESSPIITNCTFIENINSGMVNRDNSNPVLTNCTFIKNFSGGHGGGIFNESSNPTLLNCRFERNIGSGIYNDLSTLTLNNCIFIKNNAKLDHGGAINTNRSDIIISNCSFINNMSYGSGGAIVNADNRNNNLLIKNSIFSGNKSRDGSGGAIFSAIGNQNIENCVFIGNKAKLYGSAIRGNLNSTFIIQNSIFRSNHSQKGSEIYLWKIWADEGPSSVSISYSNIKGDPNSIFIGEGSILEWKEGNIDVYPLFVNPGYWDPNGTPEDANDDFWIDGDYHLKTQAGRWDSNSQTWVQDDVTSPCIDAGDPNTSIGLEPFPNGGYINMGAYGGTAEASKSYFGEPLCETIVAGDINGDCKVDFKDFSLMALHWLE